ncbi:teichuronic acid biosynthesis protein TuaE [Hathewaya proteolytica DSM 3090]|uniref:Teichuronic acid biosynthesis protein TuaE n=1 Tax=Hathewaya proteolytica DSM 3090 TaxID=1121331 RepID=A0A1M6QTH4_9CLOT|nr:O-antigen ligase family protein [Hathewaya proteolytica]SHK23572.1 teichuronic acid biosynthesis protein TuaE [Hathewaya proteolytica DSM 3090]
MKNKDSIICLIITILALVVSYAMKRDMPIIYAFSLLYVVIIYIKFKDNSRKLMYFTSLFFAIFSFGHRKNYYVAFVLYAILFLKEQWNIIKEHKAIKPKINLNKYGIFLIVFCCYMVLSVLWSMDKHSAVDYLIKYAISISMILMIIFENRTKKELSETFDMASYVVLGVLLIGLIEITGYDFGLPNHFEDKNIVYKLARMIPVTFFYNSNNYAVFLVIALIMSFRQVFYKKTGAMKIINLINVILIIINIIFSRSRVAFISCILALSFVAVFSLINLRRSKEFAKKGVTFAIKHITLICFIFICISIFPNMSYYTGKFAKIPVVAEISKLMGSSSTEDEYKEIEKNPVIGQEGSDSIRLTLIHDVVVQGIVKDKNYFGVGVGNSVNYIKSVGNTHGILNIHSLWFEILCEFGIPIFLYTVYIYVMLFIDYFKLRKKVHLMRDDLYLSGITLTVANVFLVFGPSFVISFTPFIISIGIMYSICSVYKKDS